MQTEDIRHWLRLSMTEGVGNESARRLLGALGSVQAIFEQPFHALTHIVSEAQAHALMSEPPDFEIQMARTLQWLASSPEGHARALWSLDDPLYPTAFFQLSDPPLMLYAQGQLSRRPTPALSIVGSRNPTPQGVQIAQDFAQSLVEQGICVVSGLALGIDGAAHAGALTATTSSLDQCKTVAIVGTGLDRVYPRQHHALAQDICAHGWMISEFHLGQGPLTHHFPRRNRLIAALGSGTLVVEAAQQSGSLITADMAIELGRDVMAVPGSIYSTHSKGCHQLIRQGAILVETIQDILHELPQLIDPQTQTQGATTMAPHNPAVDDPLLQHMGFGPFNVDELQLRSGIDTALLQTELLRLELAGAVARMPGGGFQRISNA